MNNLKCKLLKALMGVSLGALGAFAVNDERYGTSAK